MYIGAKFEIVQVSPFCPGRKKTNGTKMKNLL